MTRQQRYLENALLQVHEVAVKAPEGSKRRKAYGGLCHEFPVLVLTNGLCQTMAFIEAKARGAGEDQPGAAGAQPEDDEERASRALKLAYSDLRDNIISVLDTGPDPLDQIRRAPLQEYMRQTRTILEAWVYYKRFAVSVLGIQPGDETEGEPA